MPAVKLRDDELYLYDALHAGMSLRDAARAFGVPWRRLSYIVEKWGRKGWYDYGVAADLGWLDDEAPETLREEPYLSGLHAALAPARESMGSACDPAAPQPPSST